MARDDKAVNDFIEQSAAALTAAGFPRMPARVLMALMVAEGDGMTAQEIADRLVASAASVSGAVRYLQTVRMIRRVSRPGSRRDLYELPEDSWYTASIGKNTLYDVIEQLAARAVVAIDDPDSVASRRVAEMSEFFVFIQRRLPEVLEEWEELRRTSP